MKKKLLFPCLLLSLVMLLTCVCAFGVGAAEPKAMSEVTVATPAVAGDVVAIASEADLQLLSAYVSAGGNTEGVEFRLESDITLSPVAYGKGAGKKYTNLKPIGGMYDGAEAVVAFRGIFNGNGKTISGLQITEVKDKSGNSGISVTADQAKLVGLFAKLDGATVKDLSVTVTTIKNVGTNGFVGVLAAEAVNATLVNCNVSAASSIDISALKSGATFGGIIGKAVGTQMDACVATLEATGDSITGGLVGVAENSFIRNSLAHGKYTHKKASALGGMVGELLGTSAIENSYSDAEVVSTFAGDYLGGIAAKVGEGASVENCFSAATVTASGTSPVFGALVGENNGAVQHSYALRAEPDSFSLLKGHYVIGAGNAGTEVFAYQPKTENGVTSFLLGTVETLENLNCWEFADSQCKENETNADCALCGGDGVLQLVFRFKADTDSGIASLEAALNDWVNANEVDGVRYERWSVVGDRITVCTHTGAVEYKNITEKPTCSQTGIGDKYCTCGKFLEAGVVVPKDPTVHSPREFTCVDYVCAYGCGLESPATTPHNIGDKHCVDQECSRCKQMVEATQPHTNPDYDANKLCAEYDCSVCGTHTRDEEHDIPEVKYSCEDATCSVCGYVAQKGKPHRPGRAANCFRAQTCTVCSKVIVPAKSCVPGPLATCGEDQVCLNCGQNACAVCGAEYGKATGDHDWNKEHATCTADKECKVCGQIEEKRTGHSPDTAHTANCGEGRACLVCHVILDAAVGEHTVDWANATVVRAATTERTGISVGICSVCHREVEAYTSCVAMEELGNALVSGGSLTFYAGTHVTAVFGKVADYKSIAYADGYLPLQVVTLSVLDSNGAAISVSGGVTVKVVLNKSAAKMANGTLKLYSVADGKATEVAITAQEDGYVTFSTSSLGTFVLAGEKTAAFTVLGSIPVQAKQTAALVGTPAYDRRDSEI